MAQYHFHAEMIQRSAGQSAVATAAYRAGERINDDRIGKEFDYRRKSGILHTEIMTPLNAPEWMLDRSQLWNAVEKSETRKNNQLARSFDISLMAELSLEKNLELIRRFVQEQWVDQGMVADIAVHEPGRNSDQRNIHAHVLLTTREITANGFGGKQRDWNDRKEFLEWRKEWADHANRMLEQEGLAARIDHRSLIDQGIDRQPTTHVGPSGKAMERKGKSSDRAQLNRDIANTNGALQQAKDDLARSEERLAELLRLKDVADHASRIWDQSIPGPLNMPGAPGYSGNTAEPGSNSGKKSSMPDDLSEREKIAAEQQAAQERQAQETEKARQDQATKDEADRVQKLRDDENKRVEELAKLNIDRQTAQAEEMRLAHARALEQNQKIHAAIDAHNAEVYRRAQDQKRKEEAEHQARLEEKAKEGPIRNAGERYSQALGQNYDIRDPYASLAKSAMAEYTAFMRDRQAYDRQIAQTVDPIERQALDLRKRIEGADYLALTGDRIAAQSEIITGRRNSQEALYERERASNWRIQAQDMRQQLRELRGDKEKEKETEKERGRADTALGTPPKPDRGYRPRGGKSARDLEALIKEQDEKQKKKDELLKQEEEKERQRDRDRGRGWER
jgi:hypothetical protein